MKKIFRSIVDYFQSVVTEFKRITFPGRKQVTLDSSVVIIAIIVGLVVIGLYDGAISTLIKKLIVERSF